MFFHGADRRPFIRELFDCLEVVRGERLLNGTLFLYLMRTVSDIAKNIWARGPVFMLKASWKRENGKTRLVMTAIQQKLLYALFRAVL